MSQSVTIALSQPVVMHNVPVASITLKEPTGGQYLDHGEPRIFARTADGTFFWIEDKAAIKAYLAKGVDHENGADILRLLGLADVKRVKEALFGFFLDTAPTTSES